MIVMKQSCMWRFGFSIHRLVSHAVDEIDVQPTIIVVVQQRHATAQRFRDVSLLWRPARIPPCIETGLLRNIVKDDRAAVHKSARRNWPMLHIMHWRVDTAGARASLRWCALLGQCPAARERHACQQTKDPEPADLRARARCPSQMTRPA